MKLPFGARRRAQAILLPSESPAPRLLPGRSQLGRRSAAGSLCPVPELFPNSSSGAWAARLRRRGHRHLEGDAGFDTHPDRWSCPRPLPAGAPRRRRPISTPHERKRAESDACRGRPRGRTERRLSVSQNRPSSCRQIPGSGTLRRAPGFRQWRPAPCTLPARRLLANSGPAHRF